jgi:putative membrane protein
MPEISDLPHINATLNGLSALVLSIGYYFIRHSERSKHRACMILALAISGAFLITYIIYKINSGFAKFGGEGLIRPIYFTILIVHVLAAIAIVPLVPITVYRALKGQFDQHRKIAKWTFPIWFFVGISGVVVYVMAIQLYPYVPV